MSSICCLVFFPVDFVKTFCSVKVLYIQPGVDHIHTISDLTMEIFAIFVIASQAVFILAADGQNNEDWGTLLKLGQAEQEESSNTNIELQNPNNVEPPNVSGEEIARAPSNKSQAELEAEYYQHLEQGQVTRVLKRRQTFDENQQKLTNKNIENRIRQREERRRNTEESVREIELNRVKKNEQILMDKKHTEKYKEEKIRRNDERARNNTAHVWEYYEKKERDIENRNRQSDEKRMKNLRDYIQHSFHNEDQTLGQSGEASTAAGSNQNKNHPVPFNIHVPAQGSRAAAINPNLTIRFPFEIPDPAEGSSSAGLNRNPTYPFPSHSVVPQFSFDSYSGPFAPLPTSAFPSHSFVSQFPFSFYSGPFAPQLPQPTQYSEGATSPPTTLDLLGGFGNQTEYDLPKDRPTTLDLLGAFGNQTDTN